MNLKASQSLDPSAVRQAGLEITEGEHQGHFLRSSQDDRKVVSDMARSTPQAEHRL